MTVPANYGTEYSSNTILILERFRKTHHFCENEQKMGLIISRKYAWIFNRRHKIGSKALYGTPF